MPQPELLHLVPDASLALRDMLDSTRGAVEQPIRSEIFGLERFAQHGRSLGETHRVQTGSSSRATFSPRLRSNIRTLREAYNYIGVQARTGYDISPAAEWLLDNFHLIETQLKEIHEGLPRSYFRALPVLLDEPLAGLPRVYGVAWAFVAHTDGAFDESLLMKFLSAYQETRELKLSEMWALPTTLRVVLIENLRRLAERVATNKASREVANLCCDQIENYSLESLNQLLALLNERGVGKVFLAQMAQRLQDYQTTGDTRYRDWLQDKLPDLTEIQLQQPADQAADNLSVSNSINSLRAIGDADWSDIVSRSSVLMRLMLTSSVFEAEHVVTRDQTLHEIELLARRSVQSEVVVAQTLLDQMRNTANTNHACQVASYWLQGPGRPELIQKLGLNERAVVYWRAYLNRITLPAYLSSLLFGTLSLIALILSHNSSPQVVVGVPLWLTLLGVVLMAFPASEAVLALINRLISESARPKYLPRLAFTEGIPSEHRVMVVIPAMLSDAASIQQLVHRLQLHYLANSESEAQFALLSDWVDADTAHIASDAVMLENATQQIRELNERYPSKANAAPRFLLLHRERHFSETEQRWIGWERKRGKLELLVGALAEGSSAAFIDLGNESRIQDHIKYIVTLDSDTQLPPGRLRDLVGVAAHPSNQPQLDTVRRRIFSGYGILQPRVVTPLPLPKDYTLFNWLFAGQCGIDPYSAATSEVYQDVFGEGTFTGKGLLNVQAMHAVLSNRLPEGQVLSHDLLEGSLARCAAVTDITVIEDAPFHADVAASRVHRWTRGDWQLLPFLLSLNSYRIRGINRWKMFDNLRRSLVAPMSLLLLILALMGKVLSPSSALMLIAAAFSIGPLMGAVAAFSPSRDDVAKRHFYLKAFDDLTRALLGGLWHLSQLLPHALMALDAIFRALYRTIISHRHLLQWTTAAAAQSLVKTRLSELVRQHWKEPLIAALLFCALFATATPFSEWAFILCLLWAASPLFTWWVSKRSLASKEDALNHQDQSYLEGIARDTWRLFERCVGAEDNYLPPDNLQTTPHDMVAHRTSPTNIGLYLLSTACARQFGWIGTQELLTRMESTLATLLKLQRYRGHFLNWYDTQTCAPLLPMYVSCVDSGNLSGHLLAVAQACEELAHAPHDLSAAQRAIHSAKQRLTKLLARRPNLVMSDALMHLLAMHDPLSECQNNPEQFESTLNKVSDQLPDLLHQTDFVYELTDYLSTLRFALQDARVIGSASETAQRLHTLAREYEKLAWQADFSFLYHRKRHLFHIGYQIAEQQLDASFYDLLASESRLSSLLAIAKGDVPVAHWAALGRPFYAVESYTGLRSWSGSMFEYLMPSLILEEPHGSVLYDACRAALHEQIKFANDQDVPWGISESAYAASDHTLAYQYAPQGVPSLALRRTPPDELVIAPYATALASQIAPHRAVLNYARMQTLGGRARYGFIEALDFSASRQTTTAAFTRVDTFMAHHQGMSIVAIANVLLSSSPRHWAMANAHIESVSSLLHERSPREISALYTPPSSPSPQALQKRRPGLLRDVSPGLNVLEPTHLLSNGRYSVALRANGAGYSRWGKIGITRWRDDALRDAYGSFFYVRRRDQQSPVSITQHPAPDPAAHYHSVYHSDRVCFDATWSELQAHTTVWVSPEDDIEFRQVELRNLSNLPLDIELISAFEVTMAEARADEAHPAFSNFFVRAESLDTDEGLLFERKARLASEQVLRVAHFLTDIDAQVMDVRTETNRKHWLGRNHTVSQPLASFVSAEDSPDNALDTGLDPVCVLAVQLRIQPNAKALLTFATAASNSSDTLRAVIDKYRQHSYVQRASLMSATLTGIRLRALGISAEKFAAIQTLTTALVLTLTRPHVKHLAPQSSVAQICDRRLLWRFGISGDRPLILVMVGASQGLGLLRSLAQGLHVWTWGGIACDLVVINTEPASYQMALHREIVALRERYASEGNAPLGQANASLYVLRADEVSTHELSTLQTLAQLRFNADGRPLAHHIQELIELHEQAFEERHQTSTSSVSVASGARSIVSVSLGEFAEISGEFRFNVSSQLRPVKPWVNVMANPGFGAQLSEAGGGYTWAGNSRLNQLTAWSNDPVADPPAEWFLLQDMKSHQVWSVSPSAWGDNNISYRVSHGQGYSSISHRRGDLDVVTSWCVDPQTAVKQVRLRLTNRGHKTLQLRAIGIIEWMMGAYKSDRRTVHTALHCQRLPSLKEPEQSAASKNEQKLTALLCTQRELSAGFGDGTAFLAMAGDAQEAEDWTCDRRECFDSRGRLVLPDYFGQRSGDGLDPCAALSTNIELKAGDTIERVFLLGYAENAYAAQQLAAIAATVPATQRLQTVRDTWDKLLGATTVKTPDPLFDAMVNRWLLYQTVSCRLWAKAGFYQAGGATGFRDQLQDAMALAWAAPSMLREQIVLAASRQFPEGDVQHWWHSPGGAGVRTHFSDDLLWLPYACVHYLRATDDRALLDQIIPFIEGAAISEGAEDAYYTPTLSTQAATVYEHAARTIDRSLRVGVNGLPLMGSGDWNDGMNRVGHEGRGESVWLGWFLCKLVADFAPLARERADVQRAQRWEKAALGWKAALSGPAWDGQWFKRAFFDNGQALGSHTNTEARIDLIAQAWAVLSNVASPALQRMALTSLDEHLVDHEAGLIKLLAPPLVHANPSAGYIQAYPPGVRENGGQYSHAGVWALMAQAEYAKRNPGSQESDDIAYRYFTYLSPAHRVFNSAHGEKYGVEPYVMAGDVYTHPPYVGQGGWSWYTGAASWMQRAAIESIFGLHQGAQELYFNPCLPSHWQQAELSMKRDERTMRFILMRATESAALQATAQWNAQLLRPGEALKWQTLAPHTCFVIPLRETL